MNRDDVSWQRLLARLPDPVHRRTASLDLDALRALLEWYIGEGMHGIFVNGTTGEWFSQTPRRAPARRRDRDRPGRRAA